jgi:hypothetical protein
LTIFHGLPFAEYTTFEREHFSRLKLLDVSPLAYSREGQRKETDALRLGRAVHAFVLEPESAHIVEYDGTRSGSKWEEFAAAHKGAIVLKPAEFAKAAAMRDAVHAHPAAKRLLSNGEGEVSLFFDVNDVRCKGRVDWITDDYTIVELKTTRTIVPGQFASEYARRQYHSQAAFYELGFEAEQYGRLPIVTIALENAPPFDVAVYRVGSEIIEAGTRKVLAWFQLLKECRASGRWPGVGGDGMLDLQLPDWALTEGLPDIDMENDDEQRDN